MEWLKNDHEAWAAAAAKPDTPAGMRVPDGKHRSIVAEANYDLETRAIKYKMAFPDLNDRVLSKTTFLYAKDGAPAFDWAKRELALFGVDVEAKDFLDKIDQHVASIVGKAVQSAVVTPEGKKFSNIYFNALSNAQPGDVTATW